MDNISIVYNIRSKVLFLSISVNVMHVYGKGPCLVNSIVDMITSSMGSGLENENKPKVELLSLCRASWRIFRAKMENLAG